MTVSVIIPVLNERACLPETVNSILRSLPDAEIITVDGGSHDGSLEWLLAQGDDVRVINSVRGKGPQQNAGALMARGEVLLFLHADCKLPHDSADQLAWALSNPTVVGGGFFVRFQERRPFSLHVLAFLMNFRLTVLRRCFGDQALFIRREIFDSVGGFPDWPLFEDYELVRRVKKHGSFAAITSPLTISARRFLDRGVWRTVVLVLLLQVGYHVGVPPARLKRWFVDVRPHLPQAV